MSIHDQPERPPFVPEHLPWPVPKGMKVREMKEAGYPYQIWMAPRNPRSTRLEENRKSKARPDPSKNLFVRMQQTEEGRALWKLWTDKRFAAKLGRPLGATEGILKSKREKIKHKAKAESKEIVKYMESKGYEIPKKEFAKEAIEVAVEVMRRDDIHPKDKLAAAKTVLDWTLAKPASEANVNVKTAESFLEDIAAEMGLPKE